MTTHSGAPHPVGISYEEFLRDREEMPVFNESIFHPERELYKLGLNDEDIECLVQFFKWHLEQRNRRLDRQRIIAILKLRAEPCKVDFDLCGENGEYHTMTDFKIAPAANLFSIEASD